MTTGQTAKSAKEDEDISSTTRGQLEQGAHLFNSSYNDDIYETYLSTYFKSKKIGDPCIKADEWMCGWIQK